jgi:hypothetical protein
MNSDEWYKGHITWSTAETRIARSAFELAYQRQCMAIREQVKKIIVTAPDPSDIWQVHDYLSEQRKIVGQTFDYRYSVLLEVFSKLLRDGWLTDADLLGLREDKIATIKRLASL